MKNVQKMKFQVEILIMLNLIIIYLITGTLGQSVCLEGDSRCEFESTGFLCQIALTKT